MAQDVLAHDKKGTGMTTDTAERDALVGLHDLRHNALDVFERNMNRHRASRDQSEINDTVYRTRMIQEAALLLDMLHAANKRFDRDMATTV